MPLRVGASPTNAHTSVRAGPAAASSSCPGHGSARQPDVHRGRRHVPFDIKRVYYLYDVPGGECRGGHAHQQLQQLFIAVSGSFDVVVDDGTERERFHLNRSYYGLLRAADDLA